MRGTCFLTALVGCLACLADTRGGLTAETAAFLQNLRDLPASGKFVYSWTHPWQENDETFRESDGQGGWKAKKPSDIVFRSKLGRVADEAPVLYFVDLNFVAGSYLGAETYAKNRASLQAMILKAWHDYRAVPVFSWHLENPYVPSGWKDPKYGEAPYRYRYLSEGYPQPRKCVFREILEGVGMPCGLGRSSRCRPDEPVVTNANPRVWYEARLKEAASFFNGLKDEKGCAVPVVMRLFHECEDDWMWWGRGSTTVADYVEVFRFSVRRMRELTDGGKNVLFAYSPDRWWWTMGREGDNDPMSFMGRYPGDASVDVIGYDDYLIGTDTNREVTVARFNATLKMMRGITAEARRRGKACGLFESGAIGAARPDYYDWLHKAMTAEGCGFAFANLWGGYEIPRTEEGQACMKRFLDRPEVITFRDGAGLTGPQGGQKAGGGLSASVETVRVGGETQTTRFNLKRTGDSAVLRIPRQDVPRSLKRLCVKPSFATAKTGEEGYWVLPDGTIGTFREKSGTYVNRRHVPMAFCGMKTPRATFVAIVRGMPHDFVPVVRVKDGVYSLEAEFGEEAAEPYEDIVIEFRFLNGADADYSGMARTYRKYQLDRGACKSIRERMKEHPELAYAARAPEVRIRQAWKPVPSPVPDQTEKDEPPVKAVVTFDRVRDIADECLRQGVTNAEFCLVGWNCGGHDGRWPQVFPVEPALGGEAKLKEAVRYVQDRGFQIVGHGNYRDAYMIADCWDAEYVMERNPDGTLRKGKTTWGGGRLYTVCPRRAYERFVEKSTAQIKTLGFRGLYYIDVVTCVPVRRCTDARHALDKRESAAWEGAIFEVLRDRFGGSASEGANDFCIGALDSALTVNWASPFDPPKNALVDGYIPLWHLVYNGIVLATPFRTTINCSANPDRRYGLKLAEFGGRPTFYWNMQFLTGRKFGMGDADLTCGTDAAMAAGVAAIRRGADEFARRSRLQFEFMDRHEKVAENVYRVTYSDATKVLVNYGNSAVVQDGVEIPSLDYVVVEGRRN